VDADRYDADRAEHSSIRRQLFLREVREAEAEYVAGPARECEDVEELIADLGRARVAVRLAFTPRFGRRTRRLTALRQALLRAALRRFAVDPRDPVLRTHGLLGDLDGSWAFAVDDNLRVLFRWDGDVATPVTLGTHDGVD
jgi:plasmid maintenance system killer protein